MSSISTIEIPLSKTKLFLAFTGAILFIIFGYFIFTYLYEIQHKYNPIYAKWAGMFLMIFFGIIAIYKLKKLFGNQKGLIINNQGIIDHSSSSGVGLIEWSHIKEIRSKKAKAKSLHLIVDNPEFYIQGATNAIVKQLLSMNQKMYQTPIIIDSLSLKCTFEDLEKWIQEGWEKSKVKN